MLFLTKRRMESIHNMLNTLVCKNISAIIFYGWIQTLTSSRSTSEWNFSQKSYEETEKNNTRTTTLDIILRHFICQLICFELRSEESSDIVRSRGCDFGMPFLQFLSIYLSVFVWIFSKSLFADAGLMALQRRVALNTFPPSWQIAVPAARRAPDSL